MEDNKFRLSHQLYRIVKYDKGDVEAKLKKVKYMVKLGADVNACIYGKTILSWVKEDKIEPEVMKFLKENGAEEWEISKKEALDKGRQCWGDDGRLKSMEEIREVIRDGGSMGAPFVDVKSLFKELSVDDLNSLLKETPDDYVIFGHVILSGRGLTELPDMSRAEVGGAFICSNNKLTSLKGAPKKNYFMFDCSNNQLTTLEGGPQGVCANYDCHRNNLTSLKGAPREVHATFECNNNKLLSLEGGPEVVKKVYSCQNNKLKDLVGAPSSVGMDFDCRGNELVSLKGKPKKIGENFIIEDEVLQRINDENRKNGGFWNKILGGIGR